MSGSEYGPPSGSAGLVPAHSQKTVAFPDCAKRCAFVKAMGAGECESACPWKFDGMGRPLDGEKIRQNDKLSGGVAVRSDAMLAAAFDLVSAARRVRSKFGTDDNGNPLDWTEWRDVDDACNAIDRIAANAPLERSARSDDTLRGVVGGMDGGKQ